MTDDQVKAAFSEAKSQIGAARLLGVTVTRLRRYCLARGIEMPRGSTSPGTGPRLAVLAVDIVNAAQEEGGIYAAAKAIGVSYYTARRRLDAAGIDHTTITRASGGRKRAKPTAAEVRAEAERLGTVTHAAVALGIAVSTAYAILRENRP